MLFRLIKTQIKTITISDFLKNLTNISSSNQISNIFNIIAVNLLKFQIINLNKIVK